MHTSLIWTPREHIHFFNIDISRYQRHFQDILEKKSQLRKQRQTAQNEQKQLVENGEKSTADEARVKEEEVPSTTTKHTGSKGTNGGPQKAWSKESVGAHHTPSPQKGGGGFSRSTKSQPASHEKQPRASSVKVYSRKPAVEDDKVRDTLKIVKRFFQTCEQFVKTCSHETGSGKIPAMGLFWPRKCLVSETCIHKAVDWQGSVCCCILIRVHLANLFECTTAQQT